MNKQEVLDRGYAQTREEWWYLVNHNWNPIFNIIGRFAPKEQAAAEEARKDERANDLYLIFQRAWAAAPDAGWIHDIRGWGQFCDLCSDFPEE